MFSHRAMHYCKGFTLLELLVSITIVGILMSFATFDYRALENPVQNGAQALMGFMKKTRAKALASTLAYTITAANSGRIITTYSTVCSGTQTADSSLTLNLPSSAHLTDTSWSICYNTRGLSDNSADIVVSDGTTTKTVQVVLGGGIRVI